MMLGFVDDPNEIRDKVQAMVRQEFGEEWALRYFDKDEQGKTVAIIGYRPKSSKVTITRAGRITMRIRDDVKPTGGDSFDAENGPILDAQNPDRSKGTNYRMVVFDPHGHTAAFEPLSTEEQRVRGVIASNVFRLKPWDVEVHSRPGGGFNIVLPAVYQPSKHDELLDKVVTEVIGQPGWWAKIDPKTRVGTITPGELPMFPPVVPHPLGKVLLAKTRSEPLKTKNWARIPLGVILPPPGQKRLDMLVTDFEAMPAMQISGIAGSGKGVLIQTLGTGALFNGWELALVDAVKAGVDYIDIAPFAKPGFFATDLVEAVCVLQMAYDEGTRRKQLIQQARVQKFSQLDGIKPLMVIVDEATSLFQLEPVPKGIPKDHPVKIEIDGRNILRATALNLMSKIPREMRFAGISAVLASQVASATVGIPTELRANLPAKILLGGKPTKNNRNLALLNPDIVPEVPDWIVEDPSGAWRGVGVYEFEGRAPGVVKVFYTHPTELGAFLAEQGLPQTSNPRPSRAQIAKHVPDMEPDLDEARSDVDWNQTRSPISGRHMRGISRDMGDTWDDGATGFEKANLARHVAAATGKQQERESRP